MIYQQFEHFKQSLLWFHMSRSPAGV